LVGGTFSNDEEKPDTLEAQEDCEWPSRQPVRLVSTARVGLNRRIRREAPKCRRAFIPSIDDSMEVHLDWIPGRGEAHLQRRGSGSGRGSVNLSQLRSSQEATASKGATPPARVSFMRGAEDSAARSSRAGTDEARGEDGSSSRSNTRTSKRVHLVQGERGAHGAASRERGYDMSLGQPRLGIVQYPEREQLRPCQDR